MTEDAISETFRIGGSVHERVEVGSEQDDWRSVASPATIAALEKARFTSTAVTLSAVRSAAVRQSTAIAHTMMSLLLSHVPKSNQAMQRTAGRSAITPFHDSDPLLLRRAPSPAVADLVLVRCSSDSLIDISSRSQNSPRVKHRSSDLGCRGQRSVTMDALPGRFAHSAVDHHRCSDSIGGVSHFFSRSPLAWWFIPAWGVFSLVQIPFIRRLLGRGLR